MSFAHYSTLDTGLNIVDRPTMVPGQCAASLLDEDPNGFIDTFNTPPFVDPRIYISVSWVLETGRKLGLVDAAEVADLAAENESLREQLEEATKTLNAVGALEARGFKRVGKPGRPKAVTVKTEA